MRENKLYNLTNNAYRLPAHLDRDYNVISQRADDIPMISWPDGRWCIEANMFMLELYHRNLSRKNNGGTLKQYAANVSSLLRFCYKNNIRLHELTNSWFTAFINSRKKIALEQNDSMNSVIAIGRNCIQLLVTVGKFHSIQEFIGEKGRIRASKQVVTIIPSKGKKPIQKEVWTHASFPMPDPEKRRDPISQANIAELREAVMPASSSLYLRKRRYQMLLLLEITGGRRSEICECLLSSVLAAGNMNDKPMLQLTTKKKKQDEIRYVPVTNEDIAALKLYINTTRSRLVKKFKRDYAAKGKRYVDPGTVLLSERTGKALKPNTITQEVSILANAAGIEEQACPHLFRHRFVTKIFVALLEQHECQNAEEFRKLLLDTESLKHELMEWTGHSNIDSLEHYLHLAIEEVTSYKRSYNIVNASRAIDSFRENIKEIKQDIAAGVTQTEALNSIAILLDALENDLDCSCN